MSPNLFVAYYILDCDVVYLADKLGAIMIIDGGVGVNGVEAPSPVGTSVWCVSYHGQCVST